jgi:hypothetical protein
MNTRFKVFASYNILQYMCDFIHVLIFVTVSKCRKSPKFREYSDLIIPDILQQVRILFFRPLIPLSHEDHPSLQFHTIKRPDQGVKCSLWCLKLLIPWKQLPFNAHSIPRPFRHHGAEGALDISKSKCRLETCLSHS